MRFIKNPNLTVAVLAVYTAAVYIARMATVTFGFLKNLIQLH